jgi:hypothetical protein
MGYEGVTWIEPVSIGFRGVKLLASVDISTRARWITLNEQHITACTSTM